MGAGAGAEWAAALDLDGHHSSLCALTGAGADSCTKYVYKCKSMRIELVVYTPYKKHIHKIISLHEGAPALVAAPALTLPVYDAAPAPAHTGTAVAHKFAAVAVPYNAAVAAADRDA